MSIEAMRDELISEYPGDGWARKVRQMPDYQVLAVYRSIRQRKEKKPREEPRFVQTRMDLGAFL